MLNLIQNDRDVLLAGTGPNGMYTYNSRRGMHGYDHSCSNYGAMGVWACAQCGVEVPQSYWATVNSGWRRDQNQDGSWSYTTVGGHGTPSMTSGGLVNLYICQEYLDTNKAADCRGNVRNPAIDAAVQWLGANVEYNVNGYTLFNIQRDGFESGLVQFGNLDWFQIGADNLLRTQARDGSWGGAYGNIANTGFLLSFLSLGRAPVVMNKLQYANPDPAAAKYDPFGRWYQRPRDVVNITRWIEKRMHKRLNWQVVNLAMPMEILHRSPIMYISGDRKLNFTDAEKEKLKQYVLEGGIVVGNADAASKEFAESFKNLGESLFPDYAFRPLTEKHPLFQDELYPLKEDEKLPVIEALGNQVRELFILFPADDPARAWQALPFTSPELAGKLQPLYRVAGNLYYYATEHGLVRDKMKTWILPQKPQADKKLTVARIQYDGNWNPEPFGWDQMTQYLRDKQKIELDLLRVHLGTGEMDTSKFRIAYLTGTAPLELTDKQRQDLKRYAYEGGILLIDSAGGSPQFTASVEKELKAAFGRDLQIVPPTDPLFTIAADCSKVQYREKAKKIVGTMDAPLLKKIEEDGKVRVLFSPLDLTEGIVGQPIDAISGYKPDSAMPLMMNMLMFAMQQR